MDSKISVLILTQDSEATLERTLKSVQQFDEVVLIDGGSQDGTQELAKKYHARFESIPFKGFCQQRNNAIKLASHPWCLMVDSDEAVTDELRNELYRLIKKEEKKYPLYRLTRTEYLNGKEIKSGRSKYSFQERFFQRDLITYEGEVHEYPLINGVKPDHNSDLVYSVNPQLRLLHDPNVTIETHLKKLISYTFLKANIRIKENKKTNPLIIWLNFNMTFLRTLWANRKEGANGFMLAIIEATHRCLTHLLIYHKIKQTKN